MAFTFPDHATTCSQDSKRSEEHTSELQSPYDLVCSLLLEKKKGKDVNSHTVLDGIITTIMATIQRINIIGSREGSRKRRRLKANQTGKKFRVGIKSNISTNRYNLISGVDIFFQLKGIQTTSTLFPYTTLFR